MAPFVVLRHTAITLVTACNNPNILTHKTDLQEHRVTKQGPDLKSAHRVQTYELNKNPLKI